MTPHHRAPAGSRTLSSSLGTMRAAVHTSSAPPPPPPSPSPPPPPHSHTEPRTTRTSSCRTTPGRAAVDTSGPYSRMESNHLTHRIRVGSAKHQPRERTHTRTPVAASAVRARTRTRRLPGPHRESNPDRDDPNIASCHWNMGSCRLDDTHTHTHTQPPADRRGVAPRSLARQASVLLMHQRTIVAAAVRTHMRTRRPTT